MTTPLWYGRRLKASKSTARYAAGRFTMLDSTDLFKLQQWAGEVSAMEASDPRWSVDRRSHVRNWAFDVPVALRAIITPADNVLHRWDGIRGRHAQQGNTRRRERGLGFDSIEAGFVPSAAFATGLASALSLLGLSTTLAVKVMGSGAGGNGLAATVLPLFASTFATTMGLNVLKLVKIDLPSFEGDLGFMTRLSRNARAYILGASFALIASPCCTSVLAFILGFIASSRDPYQGFALSLVYFAGYTTPLMAAGTASGVLSRLMSPKGLKWIAPANGAVVISYGTYSSLDALFGQA